MDPLNFGSGSQLLGGTDALNEAIQRRAAGTGGATQQVTPASANFDPTTGTPAPQASAPTGIIANPQTGMPQAQPETQIILDSLTTYLKNEQKMKMADQKLKHSTMGGV